MVRTVLSSRSVMLALVGWTISAGLQAQTPAASLHSPAGEAMALPLTV